MWLKNELNLPQRITKDEFKVNIYDNIPLQPLYNDKWSRQNDRRLFWLKTQSFSEAYLIGN